ncbi:MAG: mannose-1-phosphate guanylyltransferase [Deltaproteobacteria bacterium]|nr:mannose-1-phosphate guanylyltransferase [Deltaproteobacteria bacterium]
MARPAADRLVCAVMAGGSGTRFWPLSRKGEPKQLLRFFGDSTLLRATVDRIAPICPAERRLVITAAHLVDAVRDVLPELGPGQVIGEPAPRNTAPCMAVAAMVARAIDPDAILALLPADHWVADAGAFQRALAQAAQAADSGQIVTLGVVPTQPETGYGYIETVGPAAEGVTPVVRFVEKPTLDRALQFLAGGRHLWNAGVFVVRADRALHALDRHLPDIGRCLAELDHHAVGGEAWHAVIKVAFPHCPSVSIDYGVMEHESDIAVVRLDAGWSDVGTWHSILGLRPAGATNFTYGPVLTLDSDQCVVISKGPFVAAVGLHNMAVVATDDATLVVPLDRSQDVRQVVAEVTARGRADLL